MLRSCFMKIAGRAYEHSLLSTSGVLRMGTKARALEARRARLNASKQKKIKRKLPLLEIPHHVTVKELANLSQRSIDDVVHAYSLVNDRLKIQQNRKKKRMNDAVIDVNLVGKVLQSLGYRPKFISEATLNLKADKDVYAIPLTADESRLQTRPPIVTVMGHVDHGKTTLLDALRKTSVVAGEAGGITQSIGAFSVPLPTGETVTFLDTPGHSVFTSMRERGAQVTDIVILVVAVDDGVMEQTIESINMAKMAEASIVVALNKCDKKGVQPSLVLDELDSYGIKCKELGGDIQAVKISALKNEGLDQLVKSIVTQSELLELKSDPDMQVQGVVIESRMEKGKGAMASIVVRHGTLKRGKVLIAGTSVARVKQLFDDNGKKIATAGPGTPADVMGWRSLPTSGQMVLEVESESVATQAARQREAELKHLKSDEIYAVVQKRRTQEKQEYENIRQAFNKPKDRTVMSHKLASAKNQYQSDALELNVIVKADVDGSLEALMKILNSYDCEDQCQLNILHHGVGELSPNELELAKGFNATVFLFNTDISPQAKNVDVEPLNVYRHKVIYHFVDVLKEQIQQKLPPRETATVEGEGVVVQVFPFKVKGSVLKVAGCHVRKGTMTFREKHRITRNNEVVYSGHLRSMKQQNRYVKETTKGMECGILFEADESLDLQVGDIIQCYSTVMEEAKLDWRPPGF